MHIKVLIGMASMHGKNLLGTPLIGPLSYKAPEKPTTEQANKTEYVILLYIGAVITLPYCFCNTEVRAVVKLHWNRWKLVR